jgi:acetyltransferase-like isoleucine patch superfamily enzyme
MERKFKNYVSPNSKVNKSAELISPVRLYGTANIKRNCRVGCFSFINTNSTLASFTKLGMFCSVGKNVEIGAVNHPVEWASTSPISYNISRHFPDEVGCFVQKKRENQPGVVIGNDVWIGSNVVILRGVKIGHGAVVGAGSIVKKDVSPYSIVGGVPAKEIRKRFSEETIDRLLDSKWWDKDLSILGALDFSVVEDFLEKLSELEAPLCQERCRLSLRGFELKLRGYITHYSKEFKESIIARMLLLQNASVPTLVGETGVPKDTDVDKK